MIAASPPRRASVVLLALVVAVLAAGCGTKKESSADPAGVVPARAPVYVEATIPPPGLTRDDALAAARKVLGTTDPTGRLQEIIRGRGSKGDVAPWLGDRVGAFSLAGSTGDDAIVAATSDVGAARTWVSSQGPTSETRKGVGIHGGARGTAYALVDDLVVAGRPAAVRAAIDAASGDDLASSSAFKEALGRVQGGAGIGRGYLAPRALMETKGTDRAPGTGMLGSLAIGALTGSLPTAVGARFHADGDAVRADIATVGGAKTEGTPDPALVADLPGAAWLALGIGEVGPRLKDALGAAVGGSDAILGLLGAQAGLDIDGDLLVPLGQGAVFVTGDSPSTVGGALVVHSDDPARTRAVVPKLASLITRFAPGATSGELHASGVDAGVAIRAQGIPAPVQIAAAGDRLIVAVGHDALREAISPSSRLGDDPDFRSAAATLGAGLQPVAYVGARPLSPLATVLARRTGADARDVTATLGRFTALVAADRGDGHWRASLGLR